MRRSRWLALGAMVAALAVGSAALAEDAPAARATSAAKTTSPKPRRRAAVAPAAPLAYDLVPTSRAGSALVRARQNSFGVRDQEGSSSGARSRHIGIGLGGGNGTTPGMAIGF